MTMRSLSRNISAAWLSNSILRMLLLALLLFGAYILSETRVVAQRIEPSLESAAPETPPSEKVQEYRNFLKTLDLKEIGSIRKAANQYKDALAHADQQDKDLAFVDFRKFLNKTRDANSCIIPDVMPYTLPALERNDAAKPILQKLRGNLLKPVQGYEGGWCPVENTTAILEEFGPFLSEAVRAYLLLWGEDIEPDRKDTVPLVVRWEKYIDKYPNSPLLDTAKDSPVMDGAKDRYRLCCTWLVCPSEVNCIFTFRREEGNDGSTSRTLTEADYDRIEQEVYKGYQDIIQKYPKTRTAALLKKYCEVLERNDLKWSPQVKSFLEKVMKQPESAITPLPDDSLGTVAFEGSYACRSNGVDIMPFHLIVFSDWENALTTREEVPESARTLVHLGDKDNRVIKRQEFTHPSEKGPSGIRAYEKTEDGIKETDQTQENVRIFRTAADSQLMPIGPNDGIGAETIFFRQAGIKSKSLKELNVCDIDDSDGGYVLNANVKLVFGKKEKVTVPAGTFDACHIVCTEQIPGDAPQTSVSDYWVLDDGTIAKAVRQNGQFEVVLQSVKTSASAPGAVESTAESSARIGSISGTVSIRGWDRSAPIGTVFIRGGVDGCVQEHEDIFGSKSFHFTKLPPGKYIVGCCPDPRFPRYLIDPEGGSLISVDLKPAEARNDIQLWMVSGIRVKGRVVDQDNKPVVGNEIYVGVLEGKEYSGRIGKIDSDGRYDIGGIDTRTEGTTQLRISVKTEKRTCGDPQYFTVDVRNGAVIEQDIQIHTD